MNFLISGFTISLLATISLKFIKGSAEANIFFKLKGSASSGTLLLKYSIISPSSALGGISLPAGQKTLALFIVLTEKPAGIAAVLRSKP